MVVVVVMVVAVVVVIVLKLSIVMLSTTSMPQVPCKYERINYHVVLQTSFETKLDLLMQKECIISNFNFN